MISRLRSLKDAFYNPIEFNKGIEFDRISWCKSTYNTALFCNETKKEISDITQWFTKEKQRRILENIAKNQEFKTWEDWYQVSRDQLVRGGFIKPILNHYGSHIDALLQLYPENPWRIHKFKHFTRDFWNKKINIAKYLEDVKEKMNFKEHQDWYKITQDDLDRLNYQIIGSPETLVKNLQLIYPDYKFEPWKFLDLFPRNYWSDKKVGRNSLDEIAQSLNIQSSEDWYKVTVVEVEENGGKNLMKAYSGSLSRALSSLYPEVNWKPWMFLHTPPFFWKDKDNQKIFMEDIAKQCNINHWQDWYSFDQSIILENRGNGLLTHYDGSFIKLLLSIYPEHPWKVWRFKEDVPNGFWADKKNQRDFFDYVKESLNYKDFRDFYNLRGSDIQRLGGGGLLRHYKKSLFKALTSVYPEYNWKQWRFWTHSPLPKGYWEKEENIKSALDDVYDELKMSNLLEFQHVPFSYFRKIGLLHLLEKYGGLYPLLYQYYPNIKWPDYAIQQDMKHSKRLK